MFKFLCGCPNLEYLDARHLTIVSSDIPPRAGEIAEALPKLVRAKINHSSILCPVLGNARFLLELKGLCLHSHVSQSLPVSTLTAMSCGTGLHKCSTIVPSFKILPSARFEFHFNNTLIYFKPYSGIFFLTKTIAYYKQEHTYTHAIGKCHWKDQQTVVPECLSSQIRTFKFKSYNGFGCEVQFAKYIMQNSKVLQNMTMHTKAVDKHQMLETFSLCPRGSANCILHFDTTPS
ncbi:putative FBD domain-containing protein [Medicago truncatula]|uniref:Putative FBD domain-containing protein n=1 Tax=Medicago truncatula TaxID=3880 RepID=A0A396HJJ0_MEDTR|nr:putative FBD domain-containing protein [Medicago truncatula]